MNSQDKRKRVKRLLLSLNCWSGLKFNSSGGLAVLHPDVFWAYRFLKVSVFNGYNNGMEEGEVV